MLTPPHDESSLTIFCRRWFLSARRSIINPSQHFLAREKRSSESLNRAVWISIKLLLWDSFRSLLSIFLPFLLFTHPANMKCGEIRAGARENQCLRNITLALFLCSENSFPWIRFSFRFPSASATRKWRDTVDSELRDLSSRWAFAGEKPSLSISVALREMYISFKSLPIFLPRADVVVDVVNAHEMMTEFLI